MDNTLDAAESGSPDLPFRYQHALRSVYDTYARFLRQPILHVPRIWPAYSKGGHPEKYMLDEFPDGRFIRALIAAIAETDHTRMVGRLERLTHYVHAAMGGFEIGGWKLRTPAARGSN